MLPPCICCGSLLPSSGCSAGLLPTSGCSADLMVSRGSSPGLLLSSGCSDVLPAPKGCSDGLLLPSGCSDGLLLSDGGSDGLLPSSGCSNGLLPSKGCSDVLLPSSGCSDGLLPPSGCSDGLVPSCGCSLLSPKTEDGTFPDPVSVPTEVSPVLPSPSSTADFGAVVVVPDTRGTSADFLSGPKPVCGGPGGGAVPSAGSVGGRPDRLLPKEGGCGWLIAGPRERERNPLSNLYGPFWGTKMCRYVRYDVHNTAFEVMCKVNS